MLKRIEPKTVTICEVEFAIYPFGAMKAANLSGELGRFFGPIVSGIIPLIGSGESSVSNGIDIMSVDLKDAMPLVTSSFASLDGDSVEKLLRKLLLGGNISCRYRDDKGELIVSVLSQDLLDEIFCQNVDDLYRLAYEVISLNYAGFFAKILARFGVQKGEETEEISEGTGSSTAASFAI